MLSYFTSSYSPTSGSLSSASQALPALSPSEFSCSLLAVNTQLSQTSPTPSPSVSLWSLFPLYLQLSFYPRAEVDFKVQSQKIFLLLWLLLHSVASNSNGSTPNIKEYLPYYLYKTTLWFCSQIHLNVTVQACLFFGGPLH